MAFEARRKAELERRVMEESALLKALIIATTGESKNGFLSRSSVFDRDGELDLDVANKDGHRLEAGIGWKKGAGTGIGRDDIEIDPLVMIEGGQAGITGAEQVEPPTGRVTFGPVAEPEGGPDATRVRTAVRGYYGRVKVCYERRLKEIPSLAGRVEIAWVVNGGKATEIYVLENTTDDAQLERCIVTSMSRWAFPADIVDFELSYPFVLAPG